MKHTTIVIQKMGDIAKITLNRPERLNAINEPMRIEIYNALENLRIDDQIRVVIITGAPRIRENEIKYSFSAGWDMTQAMERPKENLQIDLMTYIENFEKPVIAMVNGYALGAGCELALAADFIFASENAEFGFPEVNRGFMPGWGGTQRLPRRIGLSRAKKLIFTGERVSAKEAERIGLVDVVVPVEKLEEITLGFAKKIAAQAPLAIKCIKEVMNRGIEMDLQSGLKLEREAVEKLKDTEDFQEGIRAFFEKRQPVWKGK